MKDPGGDGEGKRHGCANRWPLDRPPWTTACPCQHWYFFFAGARVFKTKLILSGNKYAPRNLVSFCAAKLWRSSSLQASSQIHKDTWHWVRTLHTLKAKPESVGAAEFLRYILTSMPSCSNAPHVRSHIHPKGVVSLHSNGRFTQLRA